MSKTTVGKPPIVEYLETPDVIDASGVSRALFYKLLKSGLFPPADVPQARPKKWRKTTILAYLDGSWQPQQIASNERT